MTGPGPRQAAERLIHRSGLLAALEWADARFPTDFPRVLMFHRVDDAVPTVDRAEPDLIGASPETFARAMELVASRFHPIALEALLDALDRRRRLPPRSVLVTFDDATVDFRRHAWPVLRRLEIPAVLFVPTAFAAEPQRLFWWDALHQVLRRTAHTRARLPGLGDVDLSTPTARRGATTRTRLYLTHLGGRAAEEHVARLQGELEVRPTPFQSVLNWEELRALGSEGVAIAPHGRTHRALASLPDEVLEAEVDGSRAELEAALGACAPAFSYPYGSYDERVLASVRRAGYRAAFSTRSGFARPTEAERFRLQRIDIRHDGLDRFRLDLTQGFARYLAIRHWLARRWADAGSRHRTSAS